VKAAAKWPSLPLTEAFWFQEGPGVRNWQFTTSGIKLLNVANIEKGGTLNLEKTDRHLDETEVAKKYSHFLVDAGDLVIASSGISFDDDGLLRTRGAFVRGEHLPLCLNTSTIRFKPIDGVSDLRFLRLWLNGREFRSQITKLVTGTAQQNFGPSHLKATKITLPPLAEQRRIAEVLDRAEALRAKRRAALAQLDSLTQSLFLDLFGDPATNPKGWPKVELGEVVKLVGGYAFKSEDFTAKGNAVVRISNLTGDGIDLTDIARIPDDKLGKGVGFKIQPGEILIAMSGATTGKLGVVPLELGEDLYQNQRVGNYRIFDAARIQREFLLGLLRSTFYQRYLWQLAAGVAQPNVSGWQLESAAVPLPPIEFQREFARRVIAVEKLKTAQRASLAELDALFTTLQHRAFRGEL
jgi:type I restriction enzyme S subunit